MRIRRKPWAKQELEDAKFYIDNPNTNKGIWKSTFTNNNPIHLEIGCGKGSFISKLATKHQEINYIAADMIEAMLGLSKRNIEMQYQNDKLQITNLWLIRMNAERILDTFSAADDIERIYINFCDPWPNKKKWAKRRLTHKNFLKIYEEIFSEKGEVFFKTDNRILFEFSLNEFEARENWKMKNISLDLHNSEFQGNVMTEYEEKFSGRGMPIFRLEADFYNSLNTMAKK